MVETDPRTVGDPRVLGLRIATLRRAHGLSQRRLAEAAGVSHGYVALLELGRLPSPGKFRLDAVARALNLRTSDALLAPTAPLPTRQAPRAPLATPHAPTSPPPPSQPSTSQPPPRLPPTPSPAPAPAPAPPMPSLAEPPRRAASDSNVAGSLEQVRPAGAPLLPVFRWGSCGDPRDRESPPDPDHLEYPPPGRETLIGSNGFGVVVKGESMSARGIYDGDVVWDNPERP